MTTPTLLKNRLATDAIQCIARVLAAIQPDFAHDDFIQQAHTGLEQLELKQRVHHFIAILSLHLSDNFIQAVQVLQQVPNIGQRIMHKVITALRHGH